MRLRMAFGVIKNCKIALQIRGLQGLLFCQGVITAQTYNQAVTAQFFDV